MLLSTYSGCQQCIHQRAQAQTRGCGDRRSLLCVSTVGVELGLAQWVECGGWIWRDGSEIRLFPQTTAFCTGQEALRQQYRAVREQRFVPDEGRFGSVHRCPWALGTR